MVIFLVKIVKQHICTLYIEQRHTDTGFLQLINLYNREFIRKWLQNNFGFKVFNWWTSKRPLVIAIFIFVFFILIWD